MPGRDEADSHNSLAAYRLGEIHFRAHDWMVAASEFRRALNGKLQPKWIEVWAHINLGKIFDVTGQGDRARSEYRLAQRTKDNTRGAQDEAAKYLESPFQLPN